MQFAGDWALPPAGEQWPSGGRAVDGQSADSLNLTAALGPLPAGLISSGWDWAARSHANHHLEPASERVCVAALWAVQANFGRPREREWPSSVALESGFRESVACESWPASDY